LLAEYPIRLFVLMDVSHTPHFLKVSSSSPQGNFTSSRKIEEIATTVFGQFGSHPSAYPTIRFCFDISFS
jgi:hypothetical protein